MINNGNYNNIIKNKEKGLTNTIFKSLINENLDINDKNFRISKYDSARNTFHTNRYSEDFYNINTNKNK